MTATAAAPVGAYLTVPEALAYSRIPRRKLHELLETGEIHSKKFGRRVVVPKRALDDYLTRPEV